MGISGQKLHKNGTSPRANQQVRDWNKQAKSDKYAARIVVKNVKNRRMALNWEKNWVNKRFNQGITCINIQIQNLKDFKLGTLEG